MRRFWEIDPEEGDELLVGTRFKPWVYWILTIVFAVAIAVAMVVVGIMIVGAFFLIIWAVLQLNSIEFQ